MMVNKRIAQMDYKLMRIQRPQQETKMVFDPLEKTQIYIFCMKNKLDQNHYQSRLIRSSLEKNK